MPFCLIVALSGCSRERQAAQAMADAARTVAYVSPADIPVGPSHSGEGAKASPAVYKMLNTADELVRRGVQYRFDDKFHALSRSQLGAFQPELSCSEFVWYVYSRAGMDLGNQHLQTQELAYRNGVYANALEKVTDGTIKPGDVLIYEHPLAELQREKRLTGKCHSGHAVIVLSADEKIVVGSHFYRSTPTGAPTGAGYRRLLNGWDHWTANRTLRAVYRIKNAWPSEPSPISTPQPLHPSSAGTLAGNAR